MIYKYVFLLLFVVAATATPVFAQEVSKVQRIAIVDVDRLLSDSKAGKSIQSQHSKKREAFQKEFSGLEDKLVEGEQQLIKDKETLSPEDFSKKREALQKEFQETRSLFQKRRGALEKGLAEAFKSLRKTIIETTASVSEEKKFDIVITRESVVIVDKKMDITDDVLARMDKKITSIPLNVQ